MQKIKLNRIKIDLKRFRGETGNITELAASLKEFGQLQAILLDSEGNLIAGFRRLAAALHLGWNEIGYEAQGELPTSRRRILELEENVQRLDMEWEDKCVAVAEIHRLKLAEEPAWMVEQTAELLGISRRMCYYYLKLEDNLDIPDVVAAGTVVGAIQRLTAREQIERKWVAAEQLQAKAKWTVEEADALSALKELADESIDCIITDPPFGIGLNYRGEKKFPDSRAATMQMLEEVIPHFYRVLRPDSWIIIFFDLLKMFPTADWDVGSGGSFMWRSVEPGLIQLLERQGFEIVGMPAMWYKQNKVTSTGRHPSKFLTTVYEAILVAAKGEPVLMKKGRQNVFAFDAPIGGDRQHGTQKSAKLMQELVETFTVGGQLILDPFCGSASTGVGALRAERRFLGFEINPDYVKRARVWLSEALN